MQSPSAPPVPPPLPLLYPENDYNIDIRFLRWFPVGVLIAVFLVLYIDSRTRRTPTAPPTRQPQRPPPLPVHSSINNNNSNNIGSITFTHKIEKSATNNNNSSWIDCPICLEDFEYGDECRMFVKCNHGFHKACIDKWLARDTHCPLCRGSIRGGITSNLDRV